jgi:hypothetical protein
MSTHRADAPYAILITSLIPRFYIVWKPLVGCTGGFLATRFHCLDTGTILAGVLETVTTVIETVRATPNVFHFLCVCTARKDFALHQLSPTPKEPDQNPHHLNPDQECPFS